MTVQERTAVNPFPGLRPFLGDDDDLRDHPFFGREEQIDDLLFRLRRQRFVAVVGTSGSGKSSLVRAGLLPALHSGYMAVVGSRWRVALLRPELDPIGNLAAALADPAVIGAGLDRDTQGEFTRAVLQHSSRGLVEVVQQAQLPDGVKVLVLVDQFEELFRFKKERATAETADQAAAFVKLLLEAASFPDARIYVVLTMRSDFLGDCAQFRDLPERINDGVYLVPRMNRDQLQLAIEGPVRVAGGEIDPLLVTRLLNDVGDDPDQLPVLQHALMRTWDWAADHAPGEPLDVAHYEAIGTMSAALSRHAQSIYAKLSSKNPDLKGVAERLFRCLTDARTDPRGIRRPTRFEDACAVTGATAPDVTAVVEQFNAPGRSFLMPPAGEALPGRILDVSHESLMRQWRRLQRKWLGEEADAAAIYGRLIAASVADPPRLWHDEELALGLTWQKKNEGKINAAWAARYDPGLTPQAPAELAQRRYDRALAFLAASERARIEERELQAKRQHDEQEAKAEAERADLLARTRRRQNFNVLMMGLAFFIVAAVLVIAAFAQFRDANQLRYAATQQRKLADAKLARADALTNYNAALVASSQGKFDDAVRSYGNAIHAFLGLPGAGPDLARAYYGRSTAYDALGNYSDELTDLDNALRLNPTLPGAKAAKNLASKRGSIALQHVVIGATRTGEVVGFDKPTAAAVALLGTEIGLTREERDIVQLSLTVAKPNWVTIPRRLNALAYRSPDGVSHVLHDVAIPAEQRGIEIDMRSGGATTAVFAWSSGLAIVRRAALALPPAAVAVPSQQQPRSTPGPSATVVYIQFNKADEEKLAAALRDSLTAGGMNVPGLDHKPGVYGNGVRYFHVEDRATADRLAGTLSAFFEAHNSPKKFAAENDAPNNRVPRGQLEVWIN